MKSKILFFAFMLMFAMSLMVFFSPIQTVKATTETRYIRNTTQTVNTRTGQVLSTSQGTTAGKLSLEISGGSKYLGIRIWVVKSDGSNRWELSNGTAQAIVHVSGTGSFSATWSCPDSVQVSDDCINIDVYKGDTSPPTTWVQGWVSEQLGASNIGPSTWTVYYYTYDDMGEPGNIFLEYGSSTYNTRITGFLWTPANSAPTIGQFSAPSTSYAMQAFNVSMVASDPDGKANLKTLTVSLNVSSVDLTWTESTNATAKTDANNYADLVGSYVSELNSTSYNVTWCIKLYWNATTTGTGVCTIGLDGSTAVVDDSSASASTTTGSFVFVDGLLVKASPTWSDTDGRCNPSASLTVSGQVYYTGTTTSPTNNSLITVYCELNLSTKGTNASVASDGTFQISITAEASPIGNYAYNVYSTTDEVSTTNRTASIIVDRVNLLVFSPSTARLNVNSAVSFTVTGTYQYDNTSWTGTSTLNDTVLTKSVVGKYYFTVASITDSTYGLTTFLQNATSPSPVVWDKVTLHIHTPTSQRININTNWTGVVLDGTYDYDSAAYTGTITLNFTTFNETTAQKQGYNASSISGGAYPSVTLIGSCNTTYCIWDYVAITLSVTDSRINIGDTAVITNSSVYAYDGSPFNGTETLNETLTKTSVGKWYYTVSALTDSSYGLTTYTSNTVSVTYDAVMLFLSIDDNRIDVGATAYANLNATYAYDEAAITDGTIQLNGTNMIYQSGSWWRIAISQATVGQWTYCVNSVTGNTYGITQLGIISLSLTGDRFTIPDSTDFAFNAFTLAVWTKPTASAVDGYLISQYDGVTKDGFFLWQCADRGDGTAAWVFECIVNNVGSACYSDSPPVAGVWQHIVGVRDASGNMEMYVDGVVQTNTTVVGGGIIDSTASVYIGTLLSLPAADYNGLLCEHRFYNRALLEPEIYQLYQSRQTNNTGLVALYTRCSYDMANALWHDLSGNGHNGVIQTVTVIAGLSTDENVRPIWDSLTAFNVQVPQYHGSGAFYYQAQIKWTYDNVLIPSGTVSIAYPNGTNIGAAISNSTGWVTFIINQGNVTTGNFIVYGTTDNYWVITVSGVNATFTLYDWALNTKDIVGSALSNTNLTITKGATTVWSGTQTTLYVPADTFAVTITWLQCPVNTTASIIIAGATSTNFNCTVYPMTGTTYHFASNTTISTYSYASEIFSVSFSGATSTYILSLDSPKPTYIVNATYNYATCYTPYSALVLPHYGNATLKVSFEGWGDLYVQKTTHKLLTVTMAAQVMSITATGTAGDIATAEVYCGSRGNPVTITGWTATTYSSSLSVLTGTLTFASDKTVTMTWVSSGGGGGGGGGGPPAIQPLIATVILNFPSQNTIGTTIQTTVNITWSGVTVVTLQQIYVDSPDYASWQLLIPDGLPQELTAFGAMGTANIPITLQIPADVKAGTYIVPCIVTFGWQSGAGTKSFRTVSTLEVVVPPPSVPDLMTYWWLIMFGCLGIGMLVLRTRKRKY